jgi:hypothetical protein
MPVHRGMSYKTNACAFPCDALRQPGGFGEVSKPDPIPNSVVKRFSADGTVP